MNTVVLLEKLNKIERALDIEERATIRELLREAQQCALQLQRETPEQMRRDSRSSFHS
jgi:predicted transcriptional regulator